MTNRVDTFLVVCMDAPDAVEKRTRLLDAHLRYVASIESCYRVAGVILSDDRKAVVGSACVVHADDPAAARQVMTDDPYYPAGVWSHIEVMPYLVAFGNLEPKRIDYATRIPGYEASNGAGPAQ